MHLRKLQKHKNAFLPRFCGFFCIINLRNFLFNFSFEFSIRIYHNKSNFRPHICGKKFFVYISILVDVFICSSWVQFFYCVCFAFFNLKFYDLSLIFYLQFKKYQQMLFVMPSFSMIGLNLSFSSVVFLHHHDCDLIKLDCAHKQRYSKIQ